MQALRDNNIIENDVFMIQHTNTGSIIKFGGYDTTAFDGGVMQVLGCNSQKDYNLIMK